MVRMMALKVVWFCTIDRFSKPSAANKFTPLRLIPFILTKKVRSKVKVQLQPNQYSWKGVSSS